MIPVYRFKSKDYFFFSFLAWKMLLRKKHTGRKGKKWSQLKKGEVKVVWNTSSSLAWEEINDQLQRDMALRTGMLLRGWSKQRFSSEVWAPHVLRTKVHRMPMRFQEPMRSLEKSVPEFSGKEASQVSSDCNDGSPGASAPGGGWVFSPTFPSYSVERQG